MNIYQKLILGFLSVALLVGINSYIGVTVSKNTRNGFEHIANETIPLLETMDDLKEAGLRIVASTSEYVFIKAEKEAAGRNNRAEQRTTEEEEEEEEEEELSKGVSLFDDAIKRYEQLISRYHPEHGHFYTEIVNSGQELQRISKEIITLKNHGVSGQKVLESKENFEEVENRFLNAIDVVLTHETSEFDEREGLVFNAINIAIRNITWIGVAAFLFSIVLGFFISRSIANPIGKLKKMAAAVGNGDLDARIELKSKDELGSLAKSLNKMAENLASSLQKEKELVAETSAASAIAETEKQKAAELQEALLSRDQEIQQRHFAEEETERSYYALAIVNKLLNLSLSSTSIVETLELFLDKVLSLPYLDLEQKGAILLVEDNPEVLTLKADRGLATELLSQCAQVPFGRCLCGRAAQLKEVVFADCIDDRHDNSFPNIAPHGHYCIPILSIDKVLLGVFTLYTKAGHKRDKRIEEILLAVADVMASTIERLRALNEKGEMESHLQQAYKMEAIGTLAGGIAHDFNNILGAILGYADMAQEGLADDSQSKKDLDQVLRAGTRAKELVRQILTFSRQSNQDFSPVQIHLIAKEALKLLRSTIPTTIEIRMEIDSTSGVAMADPTQIHQVIMNLCTNAYHAMQKTGGILEFSLKKVEIGHDDTIKGIDLEPGGYHKLSVSDTGCGMNRDLIKKIFEPYFTTKEDGKGTGMGLSLIHGIVKNHGGTITVYSEPGAGSTFNVYLPRIEIHTTAVAVSSEPIPQGDERILIVDDEEQLILLMQRMLEGLGYRVTSRASSVDALQAFSYDPQKIDLVITDMTMPNMTGLQLAQKLQEIRPGIPIILCTGFSEGINLKKAKAMGIREYVNKPVIKREIATIIRKVLDGKAEV